MWDCSLEEFYNSFLENRYAIRLVESENEHYKPMHEIIREFQVPIEIENYFEKINSPIIGSERYMPVYGLQVYNTPHRSYEIAVIIQSILGKADFFGGVYLGKSRVEKMEDLKPYFEQYQIGFQEGHDNFEVDYLQKVLPYGFDKTDYAHHLINFITSKGLFDESWLSVKSLTFRELKESCVLIGSNCIHSADKRPRELLENCLYGKGLINGQFYKAWELIFKNHQLFKTYEIFYKPEIVDYRNHFTTDPDKLRVFLSTVEAYKKWNEEAKSYSERAEKVAFLAKEKGVISETSQHVKTMIRVSYRNNGNDSVFKELEKVKETIFLMENKFKIIPNQFVLDLVN